MRATVRLGLAAFVLIGMPVSLHADPTLVGIWFSPFQPDEPGVMSLIEFKADGTFREEFRKCENGEVAGLQFQSGTWSMAGGIERTITDMINGEKANVEDIYRVELLTGTQRRIRMETTGY